MAIKNLKDEEKADGMLAKIFTKIHSSDDISEEGKIQ